MRITMPGGRRWRGRGNDRRSHRQRQRRPKPRQRRALALLAGCRATGCTEAVMVAHGFNVGELDELVCIGFATATTERGQTFERRPGPGGQLGPNRPFPGSSPMPRQPAAAFTGLSITGTPERLKPPPDLTPIEREIFVNIVAAEKPERFRRSDVDLLCAYCRAIALEREATTRLREDGRVIDGKLSPWLAIMAQSHKSMLAFSHRLRLSPQGRAPTNPKRPEPMLSAYERMDLASGKES